MIVVESLGEQAVGSLSLEVCERKGLGHPDTICDALAEEFSRALCRFYLEKLGFILHHNVDKGLLFAGRARPAFGGGEVLEPFEVYLVGRATTSYKDLQVPVEELADEVARAWFSKHFHALDPEKHVRIKVLVRPGASELVELFLKYQQKGVPLANDTSIGVGFAPLSPLENLVLEAEKFLNSRLKEKLPAVGEDIKVMGVREGQSFRLTVACAAIGRYLSDLNDYLAWKEEVKQALIENFVSDYPELDISINTADDTGKGDVYLTVTGTSAEAGDDGEVGRGNRINGLITPFRPMSLEAAAGKNPISHVGKIYNLLAQKIAAKVISELESVKEAYVVIVSRIGSPITEPQTLSLRLRVEGDFTRAALSAREIAEEELKGASSLWREIVAGRLGCF
ncbi:methionine adenosyltransferase [Thermodesulfatator autotrophicus]|uniref:S-adenosylmethionine synthase n=1 Tax=Thermodesulfatator autotrophicus TaxID=1795632 RepID=A0A177E6P8_9BACT|nr:methionine adenosyltransferase [Thermodesulfatator autotrophicus]OAG27458.1 S-adenosylmethionine synthase [Thermodesulfatator autotrophicus]